ncbi:MAG TPA: PD-(D/E)XK nuclease family protein, partial [Pseudonocardiaceae bacterium]
ARLAAAGVAGADPDEWAGLAPVSVDAPLRSADAPISVTPSTVELIANCPLRWLLERHGGQDAATLPSVTGMLVHALVQLAATGASEERIDGALHQAWAVVDAGAPWFSRREHRRVRDMLTAFRTWLTDSRSGLEQLAVELDVDVLIPGMPAVRVRGRVDRVERDGENRPVIVDVKTSKNPISRDAALSHPQLAVYQLAAAYGAFDALGVEPEPGGARLLYVSRATERVQPALDEDARSHWLGTVQSAARATIGPSYAAHESADCARCPARTACPLTDSGRQITT